MRVEAKGEAEARGQDAARLLVGMRRTAGRLDQSSGVQHYDGEDSEQKIRRSDLSIALSARKD